MSAVQILVVDDNDTQSKFVSFLLEEAGYIIQIAASAEEAMDVLATYQPELILMDLQLPGIDGLELTRRLRFDPAHSDTVIVALTAYTDPSDLQRARDAGCDGHISKPIDSGTFARLVRQFAEGTHPDASSDSHDLLAELRNNFLAEGLEQCAGIVKDLQSERRCATEAIRRVIHRWASLGDTLGFPAISDQARRIEELLAQEHGQEATLRIAFDVAHRRFSVAAHSKLKLSSELILGLAGVRIGLVDFPEEEAHRIRRAADGVQVEVGIEQLDGDHVERQMEYDALVVNACADSARALLPLKLSVPAVLIGSRSLLPSLSKLPARAFDFLIAPWDAEEVLIRVHRLIVKSTTSRTTADAREKQERRPCVLIADDDPSIVALASEVLRQFEIDCDIARSGQQALDSVRRRLPDAMILDVNMPDLDGFEVLRRLRRNVVTCDLPVLLLTGRHQEADVSRGFSAGADDYMVKPFRPIELANRVVRLISSRAKSRTQLAVPSLPTVST
jgi:CheY-like chemotaxis protein